MSIQGNKMNYQLLLAYLLSVFIFIITPGPVCALVLKNAQSGFKNALLTIFGTNLSSLILIGTAVAMILGMIHISESLLTLLSFVGSIFIFYLGTHSLFSDIKHRQHFHKQTTNVPQTNKNMFLQGFAVAIANPKDIIFFMAFFPQFIGITTNASTSLLILTCLWIFLDFSLLSMYALLMNSKHIGAFKFYISIVSDVVLILIGIFGIELSLRYFLS